MDKEDWYRFILYITIASAATVIVVSWLRVGMWYLSAQVGG